MIFLFDILLIFEIIKIHNIISLLFRINEVFKMCNDVWWIMTKILTYIFEENINWTHSEPALSAWHSPNIMKMELKM